MERRQFLERMGGVAGAVALGAGVADAETTDDSYREPVVTSPLIRQWELEKKRRSKTRIQAAGTSFGDAYTSTLFYRDSRLTSVLDTYVRGRFDGTVGAFIPTRITFDSPLSIFAQPSLVAGVAKRRFETALRSMGFSNVRERSPSQRETTDEQAIAEYVADYDASAYITRPNSPAYDLPSVSSDGRVETIIYLEVSKPGDTLLLTSGIRPTDRMLRSVFHRDPDRYRAELIRLMHSVR